MSNSVRLSAVILLACCAAPAQQWSFSDSGGSVTLATDFNVTGTVVGNPPGTLSLSCPVTELAPGQYSQEWVCNGGTVTLQSHDGLTVVNGNITAGTIIETAAGGGKDHPTTYYYSFYGTFAGTLSQSGLVQAVIGSSSQVLAGSTSRLGSGTISSAVTYVNATYEPLFIADTYNNRILRVDDMAGDNAVILGTRGGGANQFRDPWGITVDSAGKIYVTDSTNCRIVQVDDMTGTNWTTFGHCGSSAHQFTNPTGLFVDSSGRIYVADTGNNRIVRINSMSGDGWMSYGAAGSGTGQFSAPEGIAVDTAGKIYVADANNLRVVRIDNMHGQNWTALTGNGAGDVFNSPLAIALDSSNRIYVADMLQDRIVRSDDMTGANWTVLGGTLGGGVNQFVNPYGVSVDPFGTVFVSDTHDERIVLSDDMYADGWNTLTTAGTATLNLPSSAVAVPAAHPTAVASLNAQAFSFGISVVGVTTASQTVTLSNIGSAPLNIDGVSSGSDFPVTNNNCPGSLPIAESCSVSVTFNPTGPGTRTGALTFTFDSSAKSVSLSGTGVLVAVSPTVLNFGNVSANDSSKALSFTVSNPGIAPAPISSVSLRAVAVYKMTNKCSASLAVNASCTVSIRFTPTAYQTYKGQVTVTDGAGESQVVNLIGIGAN